MNYKVYVLLSLKDNKRMYIGLTSNLERRIKEHNSKQVFSTKPYTPWKLVYFEDCGSDRKKAREREKYYKTTTGRRFLKNLIKYNNK